MPSLLRIGSYPSAHFCPFLRRTYRRGLSDDTDTTYIAESHSAPAWQTMVSQPFLSSSLSVPQPACLLYSISTKTPLSLYLRLDIFFLDIPFSDSLQCVPHQVPKPSFVSSLPTGTIHAEAKGGRQRKIEGTVKYECRLCDRSSFSVRDIVETFLTSSASHFGYLDPEIGT